MKRRSKTGILFLVSVFILLLWASAATVLAVSNDNFADSITISGASGSTTGSNVGATKEPGEPDHDGKWGAASVWWSWTAPQGCVAIFDTMGSDFDTVLAVYTGDSVDALTEVASNDDGADRTSTVGFIAAAGTTYHIAVDGYNAGEEYEGAIILNWVMPGPLVNDNFPGSSISGSSGQVTGHNVGATREPDEPDHDDCDGGASVWWTWTAPQNGIAFFDTVGSNFDTVLAVYTGSSVDNLTEVASNDDAYKRLSAVFFNAAAGTVYRIAVDGYEAGDEGAIVLNWMMMDPLVDNDDFPGSAIGGPRGRVAGHNVGATREEGEPNHDGRPGGVSVWWSWTAPAGGEVVIDTFGSLFDTVLAVYTGDSVGDLTEVASNDDAGDDAQSQVEFDAVAGTVYRIAVDGYDDEELGFIVLNWDMDGIHSVTLNAEPEAGGSVTGGGIFNYGESIAVTAAPKPNYTFAGWYEGETLESELPEYTFTVERDIELTARFALNTHTVTLSAEPEAGGNPTGGGTFDYGTEITVCANPNPGYAFAGWYEGETLESQLPEYTFTVERDIELTARYTSLLDPGVFRLAGANRYETAVEVSKAGWESAETVLLARGDNFPDSLAGVSLAYELNAPILLTPTNWLYEDTKDEIGRLGAGKVIILGGPAAVSAAVEAELKQEGLTVERVSGADRFATAAEIARRLADERGGSSDTAFIALGSNFPDALAAAAYGAVDGWPILLSGTHALPGDTVEVIEELGISRVYISGGPAVISEAVVTELAGMGLVVERLSGEDRFDTSVKLAEKFLPADAKQVFIATGMAFPDALAGAVLAAKENSGVLLVDGREFREEPPEVVQNFFNARNFERVTIFGGPAAVNEKIEAWFKSNLAQ